MALLVEEIPQSHGRVETVGNPSLLWTWFRAARSSPTLGPHLQSLDAYSQVPTSLGFANATLSDDLAGRIRSAGTVESIAFDNCHLSWSALRELTGLPSLQSLVITNCAIEKPDTTPLGNVESLVELRIRDTKLPGASLAGLAARQSQLSVLALEATGLTDADLQIWHGSPELTRLILHEPGLHGAGLAGLSHSRNLELLSLARTGIDDAGTTPIGDARSLTGLDLSGCLGITGKKLGFLRGMTVLSRVDLSNSGITDAGLKTLSEGSPSLSELNLRGCRNVTDAGLEWIARLPQLAILDLSQTNVTGTGLHFLKGHPRLGNLFLADTKLDDAAIPSFVEIPALKSLDVSRTRIDGARLPPLAACKKLGSLSLAGCNVRDADIEAIARIPELESLNCSNCKALTDRAMRSFVGTKWLSGFEFTGTGITEKGSAWLRGQIGKHRITVAVNLSSAPTRSADSLGGLVSDARLPSHQPEGPAILRRPPQSERWQVAHHIPRGRISAIAWSPDGKQIAYSEASYVRICDAKTFETQRILVGHRGRVTSIDWSRANNRIASASLDGSVRIWLIDKPPERGDAFSHVLVGHESGVNAVAWRPDGKDLATAGGDGTVRIWKLNGLFNVIAASNAAVNCVAWSPDGAKVVSGDDNQQVKVWDVDTKQRVASEVHPGRVTSVAWSGDGQRFASSTWGYRPEDDKPQFVDVRLWKSDGSAVASVAGRSPNFGLQWSPSPQSPTLAVLDESGMLALLGPNGEIRSRRPLPPPRDPMDEPSLAWSPDGKEIAIGGTGILTVVDAADLSKSRSSKSSAVQRTVGTANLISVGPQADRILTAFDGTKWTYCDLVAGRYFPFPQGTRAPAGSESYFQLFSPTGNRLLYVKNDTELGIWDPIKNSTKSIAHAAHPIRCLAWGPSDERIAYFDSERTIRVLKADGTNVMEWRPADHADSRLAKNPRWNRFAWIAGTDLLLVGSPASVHILNLDGTLAASFDLQGTEETFWVRPDLQRVAAPLENGKLVLWQRAKTGYDKSSIDLPPDPSSYSASRDLNSLAVGRATGEWELQSLDPPPIPLKPRLSETALAHANGAVTEIQFSPDGRRFATGGWDGLIKIWKRSGELEQTLDGNTHPIERLRWSPDGKHLLSLSRNRTVCRWSVDDGRREVTLLNTESGEPLLLYADGRIVSPDPKLPAQELLFLIGPQNGPMEIASYGDFLKRTQQSGK